MVRPALLAVTFLSLAWGQADPLRAEHDALNPALHAPAEFIEQHRPMAVGGGSQVNVDLCFAPTLPSIQATIDPWRREGRIGRDDFTPAQLASIYEWVRSAIGTRVLSESEINGNNRVLWEGAKLAEHLYVVDSSVFPTSIGANPMQSIYTFAKIFADRMKGAR